MQEGTPYIEVKLDLKSPVELLELVSLFAAIGNQFDNFLKQHHSGLSGHARLYVTKIREGSIIAELVPLLKNVIQSMDSVLIVDGFVQRYGEIIQCYISGAKKDDATRGELKDFLGTVEAVAHDTNGRAVISSAEYHETKTTKRVTIEFNTDEARRARDVIERQRIEIDLPAFEDFEDALMVFWQSNVKEPKTGKSTGEKAIIEKISSRPLAIKYETDLSRERIKHETREGDNNLYRLGFYVDGYVERFQGKPVAYRIVNVRGIIALPDEEQS